MATSSNNIVDNEDSDSDNNEPTPLRDERPEWKIAADGIKMVVNNNSVDAEKLFLAYPDSLVMRSGYCFTVFMDALLSFEEEKLNKANEALKDMEKRCAIKSGFMRGVSKIFGLGQEETKPTLQELLETQIILADSQVLLGALTFLQSDISGVFKGGWALRKAWKIYNRVYREVKDMYEKQIGPLQLPEDSSSTDIETDIEWQFPESSPERDGNNGYIPINSRLPHSRSAILNRSGSRSAAAGPPPPPAPDDFDEGIVPRAASRNSLVKKSVSFHSSFSNSGESFWNARYKSLRSSVSYSYIRGLGLLGANEAKTDMMSKETIKRLMSAVSFGYGLLHLGLSLLPPSVLRITNILGFRSDRQMGIECLMYARTGEDMRAPLATLCLLWYHTIVRPYYGVDGSNIRMGGSAAKTLIDESEAQYSQSCYFLFFKGRMFRTNGDIQSALVCFKEAVDKSTQTEMRLLSLHEEGWCHLIGLDFCQSKTVFTHLKQHSRWSKAFYCYLAALCTGACGNDTDKIMEELTDFSASIKSINKGNTIFEYLTRRLHLCSNEYEALTKIKPIYWKLLLYELLYLWNALPSCTSMAIEDIIEESSKASLSDNTEQPMKGMSKLILGNCYSLKREDEIAVKEFRECLLARKDCSYNAVDAHVSAFSQFELASILCRDVETKDEGKKLLQQINHYSNYDFEQKLGVRVNAMLKTL
ncbi:unnamed protein product [Brassicogethes aeneus]|uniref:Tetratricopeptide repeat protein 39C n=1 Tax=Brassicogethes aeneus TaxID=1431903 RepID=A0A9P0BKW0_BRAAE|nr:unnamed protein product [Brassicogethes aeneus]